MQNSFYDESELRSIGFKSLGQGVRISRKSSIYSAENISLGNLVRIDDYCVLAGGSEIRIGNYIHIGCYSSLYGGSGIIMEDFSGLSSHVTIYSESDDFSGRSLTNPQIPKKYKPNYQKGEVSLKKHVIVGVGSTILPGITLEEGAAIGAHSLVNKNCEPWTIYFGCPAKRIQRRKKDLLVLEELFIQEYKSFY